MVFSAIEALVAKLRGVKPELALGLVELFGVLASRDDNKDKLAPFGCPRLV